MKIEPVDNWYLKAPPWTPSLREDKRYSFQAWINYKGLKKGENIMIYLRKCTFGIFFYQKDDAVQAIKVTPFVNDINGDAIYERAFYVCVDHKHNWQTNCFQRDDVDLRELDFKGDYNGCYITLGVLIQVLWGLETRGAISIIPFITPRGHVYSCENFFQNEVH